MSAEPIVETIEYFRKVFTSLPEKARRIYCIQVRNPSGERNYFRCFIVNMIHDGDQFLPYLEEVTSRVARLGFSTTRDFCCLAGNGLGPQDIALVLSDRLGLDISSERM